MRQILVSLGVISLFASAGLAQASRDVVRTDNDGSVVLRETTRFAVEAPVQPVVRAGLLWTYEDPVSITESVALGNGGSESWVGHSLNDERMSKFTTTGDGTPDFVYDMTAEDPSVIGMAAASDVSLAAVLSYPSGGPITVRAFSESGGATPLWSYGFGNSYVNSGKRAVSVSADGTRIAAAAYDGVNSRLVLLDGSGGELGSATIAGYCPGVEMSADGSRILVTNLATARLFDASTMTEIYSLSASGAGGYHRISRDGTAIAAGGFNIRAAREINGVWQQVYVGTGSSDWFGYGMALSGDGETLFAVSHDYSQGYLPNDHRIVDLTTGTVVAEEGYVGSGNLQNSIVGAQVNQDGTLFVAASWGDSGNTEPEVRIYDRALTMVGSIDTLGSPFEVVLSANGQFVLVGSKAVHANTNGRGGRTYAYENPGGCSADFNGDGLVNTQDVIAFLNAWSGGDPSADFNGDGQINTQDVLAFLNAWAAGC